MEIKQAKFIKSAASKEQLLNDEIPEIAFVGRSNVGKSSIINSLVGQKRLAVTSSTPGRTRLINYFDINNGQFRFVDLPGYGYAKAGKQHKKVWASLIEDYLLQSKNLKAIILLVDIRHTPTELDCLMQNFLFTHGIRTILVGTKADKVAKSKIKNYCVALSGALKVGVDNIFAYSSQTHQGKKQLLDKIEQVLQDSHTNTSDLID